MPITQTAILTTTNSDGVEVKVKEETAVPANKATTVDGDTTYFEPSAVTGREVSVAIEFDDLVEDSKRTISWNAEDIPDDAWKIIRVTLFDGTSLVFSNIPETIQYLIKAEPLRSPKERDANVLSIKDYVPKEEIK